MNSSLLEIQNNRVVLATCNLNQWALDFDGNLERAMESIRIAKEKGAKYRLGPELELSGYSCEDHFFEMDTFMHCEQSLAAILESDLTINMLCDIGCPILHNNVRYNCRVFCLDKRIVLIRPKSFLADDGNYREKRFFTSWDINKKIIEDHPLSDVLRKVTGQKTVPMGLAVIATEETMLASEICEELWTARSPHINLFLSGVEIVTNGSGSHHELRKLDSRLNLMKNATGKCGGVYVFANQRGCDGARLYFDGCSLVCCNGELLAQASQFSLNDVEVVSAVVDLESIRSYRGLAASLQEQSSQTAPWPIINLRHFSLRTSVSTMGTSLRESTGIKSRIHVPEEECCRGPACWLWDYLRRSGAAGYLLPLSGGADSASVAAIVRIMALMAAKSALCGNLQVIQDVQKIFASNNTSSSVLSSISMEPGATAKYCDIEKEVDKDQHVVLANELTYQILHTIYLGTENSSASTQDRASRLAGSVHSYHSTLFFDDVVLAVLSAFSLVSGKSPKFLSQGGSAAEDLALQNIQARLRMVFSYLCAQLFPWVRGNRGFLLVLGSANVDEALRGYMTKYDCSSADINPIGGMSKGDLKKMLGWVADHHEMEVLREISSAAPSAELRPIEAGGNTQNYTQTDEEDMGMTYEELGIFGRLRKISRCGPVKMFIKLLDTWKHIAPTDVGEKVKRFFRFYSINRHKLTTLTPAYHAEGYSPDDNRFDLRPFLYNTHWTRQFQTIDAIAKARTSGSQFAASSSR
jgi:NAD+ synthase (glutamine-hydrolysing)